MIENKVIHIMIHSRTPSMPTSALYGCDEDDEKNSVTVLNLAICFPSHALAMKVLVKCTAKTTP
jgi:hypothetical protein